MSRFVSQLSLARKNPPTKSAAANAMFADRTVRGYTRLVRAALELLQDGDVIGTRNLLMGILATSKDTRRTWAGVRAERVALRAPRAIRDMPRNHVAQDPEEGT